MKISKNLTIALISTLVLCNFVHAFGLPKIGNLGGGGQSAAFTLDDLDVPIGGAPSDPVEAFVYYAKETDVLFKAANNQFEEARNKLAEQVSIKAGKESAKLEAEKLDETVNAIASMGELDDGMKAAVRQAQLSFMSSILLATAAGTTAEALNKVSQPALESAKAQPLKYVKLVPAIPGLGKNLYGIATGAPSFLLQAGSGLKKLNDLAKQKGIDTPAPSEAVAVAEETSPKTKVDPNSYSF